MRDISEVALQAPPRKLKAVRVPRCRSMRCGNTRTTTSTRRPRQRPGTLSPALRNHRRVVRRPSHPRRPPREHARRDALSICTGPVGARRPDPPLLSFPPREARINGCFPSFAPGKYPEPSAQRIMASSERQSNLTRLSRPREDGAEGIALGQRRARVLSLGSIVARSASQTMKQSAWSNRR